MSARVLVLLVICDINALSAGKRAGALICIKTAAPHGVASATKSRGARGLLCYARQAHTVRQPIVARPNIKTQAFLASLPLFKEIGPAELDAIAAGTTELHYRSGDVIFHRGDPCVGFHLVIYGQVKLAFLAPDGNEKVVEIVGPGGSFGEALMFLEKPYIVKAQAVADAFLLHVAKAAVFNELERTPSFARKMLAGLSRRLHGLIHDVEAYSLQSGTQRVIGYLLRQNPQGHDVEAACVVTLPTSKANVASRLNVTPEHFSRILHQLIDEKLITVEGREVNILDVARLRSFGA